MPPVRCAQTIKEPGTVKAADISLRELLRYGYGGLLAILLAGIIDPGWLKDAVATLGPALTPVAVIAIGAAAYVAYPQQGLTL